MGQGSQRSGSTIKMVSQCGAKRIQNPPAMVRTVLYKDGKISRMDEDTNGDGKADSFLLF